jgi:hypothetical protein
MNMQKVLLHVTLVFTALASVSCGGEETAGLGGAIPGSGNVLAETRQPGTFRSVTVEYPADVIVRQGGEVSIQIEADDNLLPQLTSEVQSDRLTIKNREAKWDARVNPSTMVKITITVNDLAEIEFAAPVGTLEVNEWRAGALRLVLSGGAQVKVSGIQVDLLEGVLSGVGDMQVSGMANETRLTMSGMGNLNAADLASNKAVVELSGTGDITVRVETELKATVTGAGSVLYYGTPRVEQDVKGLGSVKPAG